MFQALGKLRNFILPGIGYGLIAGVLNHFLLIPVYGQLTFHFGQVFVIVCMLVHGLRAGILASLIASTLFALTVDNFMFVVVLTAEVIFLHSLKKKGFKLFSADILYWLCIGIPISYLYILTSFNLSTEFTILVLLKQVLNGMLYALIASVIYILLPESYAPRDPDEALPSLSSRIFYLFNVGIVLPSLLVALLFSSRTASEYEEQISNDLNSTAKQLSSLIFNYLNSHQNVVENLAVSLDNANDKNKMLAHTQDAFPGFITMLIADPQGFIEFGTPAKFYERLLETSREFRNVSDREYFYAARDTQTSFVSDVFAGRGFGNDPIIAISAPLTRGGQFDGIVEGSLNLPKLIAFEDQVDLNYANEFIVVTDKNNTVIYYSSDLPLELLEKFKPDSLENRYTDSLDFMILGDEEFLYSTFKNDFGWNTYVMTKPSAMSEVFIENIVILLATLFAVIVVFSFISKRFAEQITSPLVSLTHIFEDDKTVSVPASSYSTVEVKNIAEQLEEAKDVMDSFQHELENKVTQKTEELSKANEELMKLSREDELTQLPNRRAFDEQATRVFQINERNQLNTTLALMDIDNFKMINDTFGHPFGDKCLVQLADIIRESFARVSDMTARYGGEEFIILLAGGDCEEHLNTLERFRDKVEQLSIQHGDQAISFTLSIGAFCSKDSFDKSFAQIVKEADGLLYESKQSGKNKISYQVT